MKQTLRILVLVGAFVAVGAVVVPWAWHSAFPTPEDAGPIPDVEVDSAAIGEVNEAIADTLAALGVTAEMVVDSSDDPRDLEGQAWTFTRTTVELPRSLHEEELRRSFQAWPEGAEAFLTRLDELTWSLRIYLGKRPVHQLVMRLPLDPDPAVDPASPPALAVVVAGVGPRDGGVEEVIETPYPLTLAVLPYRSHSLRYATDAARAAKEVAVHLLFDDQSAAPDPVGMALPAPLEASLAQDAFAARLAEDLDAVPYASGAVLTSDSATTADVARMEIVAAGLGRRSLYLLDLLPVHQGAALQVARRHDLGAMSCAATVGAAATSEEREAALLRARNLAVVRGSAVLVVEAGGDGLDWLGPFIEERVDEGYRLAFASELIRTVAPSP